MKSVSNVIVASIVLIVLLLAVVIPITSSMSEYASDNHTDNSGATAVSRMAKVESWTGTVEYASGATILDGQPVTNIAFASDTLCFIVSSTGASVTAMYKEGSTVASAAYSANAATIEVSGTTWTLTSNNTTHTSTFTWAYVPDPEGEYMIGSLPKYVDTESEIVLVGPSSALGAAVAKGTIDSMEVVMATSSGATAVACTSSPTAFSNEVTKLVATMADSTTKDITSSVIVPVEYTSSAPPNTMVVDLVGLIPVLLIVGLLIVLALWVVDRKRSEY